jgi:hypothetical protein
LKGEILKPLDDRPEPLDLPYIRDLADSVLMAKMRWKTFPFLGFTSDLRASLRRGKGKHSPQEPATGTHRVVEQVLEGHAPHPLVHVHHREIGRGRRVDPEERQQPPDERRRDVPQVLLEDDVDLTRPERL